MAAGPLSAPQPDTPLREGAGRRDLPRAGEWGREKREGKRGAPGLTPPRSEQHRFGEGVRLAGPRGCLRLRDPRPPRPRSAPPPSPVPRRPAVPRFSRRTGTGQARDSGSLAGGRAGGQRRLYPGITCWRLPPGVPSPRRALQAPVLARLCQDPSLAPRVGSWPPLSPRSPAPTAVKPAGGPLTRSYSGNPGLRRQRRSRQ